MHTGTRNRIRSLRPGSGLWWVLLLAGTGAQAAVTANKAFSPASMTVNGTSTITITLGNTGVAAATGTAFIDTLPGGLVLATPDNAATTCGGTLSTAAGGNTISLSGGTIPASGGSCTVTATVTSGAIGNYTNTIGAGGVTSSEGSNGAAASATLAVITAQPVTGSYAISWPPGAGGNLKGNGPAATLTLTLNNPNTLALTNAALTFSIQQPTVAFATPSNLSTTCGGTVTLNAAAGTGTLSGATIPANGNCRIVYDVVAALPNNPVYANTSLAIAAGNLTSDQGISNSAIGGGIGVQTGSQVIKSFSPTQVVSGGTSTLTLTFRNFNFSALPSIDLTDALPSGMTVAPTPNASTSCGGTVTATAGSASVQLAGGSLPAVAATATTPVACTLTVNVVGTNGGASAINLVNAVPAGNFGGVNFAAASGTLSVLPNQPLFGSFKTISNDFYAGVLLVSPGTTHTLTITLRNTTTSPITVTSVTDDVSTMGAGFTVAASPAPSTTCAGGTVGAPVGGTLVTMTGGTIPASDGSTPGTCTITAGVYVPMTPSALGNHTNTIPVGNVVTSAGNNTTPIAYQVTGLTPLILSKGFSPAAVNPGATTTLTISISRRVHTGGVGVDPLTNIAASDTLPAGLTIATPSGLTTTCTGASVTAPAGGTTIDFSGVNLNAGQTCNITLRVSVPAGTPVGTLTNTIPANSASSDQGFTNSGKTIGGGAFGNGSASANLVVGNSNVTINKTFTPANVAVGAVSQLAIQFVNTNPGAITLTQAALTDALPAGMVVANPAGASFASPGCAGTISATPGASSVGVTNAQMNAGSTCTLRVNVVASAAGNLINDIPAGALTSAQNVSNASPTTATLAVSGNANLGITKTDGQAQVAAGTSTTYTIVASNAGPHNVIGAVVADAPPGGMTFTDWTCAASAGSSCGAASGSGPINETVDIANGGTVTYTVTAQVAIDYSGGTLTNTATIAQPALVTDPDTGNNTGSDSDTVVPGVVLALTKSDGSATYTPGMAATYTIVATNTGVVDAGQVNLTDALPPGVTLGGDVTCTPAGTADCGTVTGGAGQSGFSAINAFIGSGAGNSLTFTAPVSFAAGMIADPLVNTVTATDVPSGATDSANDSDTRDASANVAIVKSGPASVIPGDPIRYTLTISNAGPSDAGGTIFSDAVPASIGAVTASCGNEGAGALCPASVDVTGNTVSGTIPTLPPGGSVVITIDGTTSTGDGNPLTNTGTVSPPAGTTDPSTANNDSTVVTTIRPVIGITKTADTSVLTPGGTVNYTITVTNTGPVAADGTLVTDPVPVGVSAQTWTCAAAGGATCTASGIGAINDTLAAFPSGSSVVYTVTATISAVPPPNVVNTASATPPDGVCAPANTPSPCTATAGLPPVPQVGIAKTADTTTVVPGSTIRYTITVSNTGVIAADGTSVSDPLPAGIDSQAWTCTPSGGAACAASGSGAINDTVTPFPAGSFVVYTVTAIVNAAPPAVISNTATATPPATGICTPSNTPPPCAATANVSSNPQVGIMKTADTGTLVPGGTVQYTVTVSNTGPVPADGTLVEDAVPAGISAQTWTCAPNAGATCTASGSGDISDLIATFPPGSFVTYTVTATVGANPPASISNTATATPPAGSICTPGATPPPCSSTVTGDSVPRIGITKTADAGTVRPDGTVVYTITVNNAGATAADGAVVDDPVPAGIASQTWTCSGSGGASCSASGSGAVSDTLAAFPPGSFATYTVTALATANPPAVVSNTATVDLAGSVCAPGNTPSPCTATVDLSAVPLIGIAKTADVNSVLANGTIVYTLTVSNTGSAASDGTAVSDPLPAGIASQTWTCAAAGGATCTASGSGAVNDTLAAFPAGSTVTYTITAIVETNPPSLITNTAQGTPPAGGLCTPANTAPPCIATVETPATIPPPVIAIDKTANAATVQPGDTVVYTITVSNPGPVAADGAAVADPVPAGIASQTWTCTPSGGATCTANGSGAIADTLAAFPVGSFVIYTVTAIVAADPPSVVSNTATADLAGAVCAPDNTSMPCSSTVDLASTPSIGITKAADVESVPAGGTITYTVTVGNFGSAAADGTTVSDPMPAGIASQTWTCAASGGATCTASGSGAVEDTLASFPPGSGVTYTIAAIVVGTDPPASVINTATALPPAGGLCAPGNSAPPCQASDETAVVQPQIAIAKTADTDALLPGGTVTYTITVTNTGSAPADGTLVQDPMPAGIVAQTWTCTPNAGATCTASGSGDISDTLTTFPAGSFVTYTVTATVSAAPPASIGNTAAATPPAGGVCAPDATTPPCSSTVTLSSVPLVGIAKAADVSSVLAGGTIVYTLTVSNAGSVAADGTTVSDPVAAGIASQTWTCAASGGASCAASGSGALSDTLAAFPPGGSAIYTITAIVEAEPPATVSNTATASPPAGGLCAPGNIPPPCSATATTPASDPAATLSIGKTADTGTIVPNGTVTYQVTVRNPGTVAANGATVADPLPAGISGYSWTCVATGGAVCPDAAGTGALAETIATLPPGGELVYAIVATVAYDPPATVTNVASLSFPGNAVCVPSGSPPPCSATVVGTAFVAPPTVIQVPASSHWTRLLLLLCVLAVAGYAAGCRKPG